MTTVKALVGSATQVKPGGTADTYTALPEPAGHETMSPETPPSLRPHVGPFEEASSHVQSNSHTYLSPTLSDEAVRLCPSQIQLLHKWVARALELLNTA